MRATDGSVSAAFQSVRLALGDGPGRPRGLDPQAVLDRRLLVATSGSSTRGIIDGAVGEEGIVAICGTPLIVESHFVGVLFAANRSARPFTREEVALLGNLATLAAVTLVQTRALADAETCPRRPLARPTRRCASMRRASRRPPPHTTASPPSSSAVAASTTSPTPLPSSSAAGRSSSTTPAIVRSVAGPAPDRAATPAAATSMAARPPRAGLGRLVERDGDRMRSASTRPTSRSASWSSVAVGSLGDSDRRTVERAGDGHGARASLRAADAADARQSARNRVVATSSPARGPRPSG